MRNALEGIRLACESDALVDQCVAGIHLEGPYISAEDGPRGAHPFNAVKDPDWEEFMALQEAAGGRICMVTLAPERKGAEEMIVRLVNSGIRVSIGHTAASYEEIQNAINAGATVSTHLGNGSHAVLPRHPHYIWTQLAEDSLWASIIADGHHLHPSVVKVMARAKGDKLFLVSDAAHLAGMKPGLYETHVGGKVELLPTGRLQTVADSRVLAGSSASLKDCLEAFIRFTGSGFKDALSTATAVPANLLQNPRIGNLNEGSDADLLLIDLETEPTKIKLMKVYKRGAAISPVET
jgi:N-acetylglucosamine-6-phosphate deacetylase